MMPLTPKRQSFVQHYVLSGNSTDAARLAGYAVRSAKQEGSRLLTFADVREAVETERGRLRERSDLQADDVIRGLRRIAEDSTTPPGSRVRAYELLGKHLRLFVEVSESTVVHDVAELQGFSTSELQLMLESAQLQPAIEGEVQMLD